MEMVERRRKKKNKLRGHRTHSKGDTKNKRGAGCRGGRGRAGSQKHKYSKYYTAFGIKRKLKTKELKLGKKPIKAINLDDLNLLIEKLLVQKKIEKQAEFIVLDGEKLNLDKILGRGEIAFKLRVKHLGASKRAMEKIKKAQGVIEFEEKAERKAEEEKVKKPEEKPKEKPKEKAVPEKESKGEA